LPSMGSMVIGQHDSMSPQLGRKELSTLCCPRCPSKLGLTSSLRLAQFSGLENPAGPPGSDGLRTFGKTGPALEQFTFSSTIDAPSLSLSPLALHNRTAWRMWALELRVGGHGAEGSVHVAVFENHESK